MKYFSSSHWFKQKSERYESDHKIHDQFYLWKSSIHAVKFRINILQEVVYFLVSVILKVIYGTIRGEYAK
jgi:hypothetical protein